MYILKLQSSALISCVHADDEIYIRVLHKHFPNCPGQVKVRFRQALWKVYQEIATARIGQAKSVLWTYNFQIQNNS